MSMVSSRVSNIIVSRKDIHLLAPATVLEVKGLASLSADTDLGPAKNLLIDFQTPLE